MRLSTHKQKGRAGGELGPRLSERQRLFIKFYLRSRNGTKSALAAGYAPKYADRVGWALLQHPRIQPILDKHWAKIADDCNLSVKKIRDEVAKVGFANMADYCTIGEDGKLTVDLSDCTREQMAAVEELTVDHTGGTGDGKREAVVRTRIKLRSKTEALTLAARILGMLKDKLEISEHYESMSDEDLYNKARQYGVPVESGVPADVLAASKLDPKTAN